MPSMTTGNENSLVDDKTFESLLIDTFIPQTVTETSDNQGGYTKEWADGAAFGGRLSQLSVTERMAQDKETAIATHKIFCGTDVDVDPDDRLKLGTRIFVVVGVQRPSNLTTEGHLEVLVKEVDYDL